MCDEWTHIFCFLATCFILFSLYITIRNAKTSPKASPRWWESMWGNAPRAEGVYVCCHTNPRDRYRVRERDSSWTEIWATLRGWINCAVHSVAAMTHIPPRLCRDREQIVRNNFSGPWGACDNVWISRHGQGDRVASFDKWCAEQSKLKQ